MAELGQSPEFLDVAKLADLEAIDRSFSSISKAKQLANEFHIDGADGGLLSDSKLYKEFRRHSGSFVGEDASGRRTVFTVTPTQLRPRKYRGEVPVSAINTMEYARDITQLKAIEGALSGGQISEVDAYEQASWVLGVEAKDAEVLLGGVGFPQTNDFIDGIHPGDALAVRTAKRQRSKEIMSAVDRSVSVGEAEAKLAIRTDGAKPESAILGGGGLALGLVGIRRMAGESKVGKTVQKVIVGTTVASLALSACSPATPTIETDPGVSIPGTTEVAGDVLIAYQIPTETSTGGSATPTVELDGSGEEKGTFGGFIFDVEQEGVEGRLILSPEFLPLEFGELVKVNLESEDAKGRNITAAIDYLNEQIKKEGMEGQLVVNEYIDKNGNSYGIQPIFYSEDGRIVEFFSYDSLGQIVPFGMSDSKPIGWTAGFGSFENQSGGETIVFGLWTSDMIDGKEEFAITPQVIWQNGFGLEGGVITEDGIIIDFFTGEQGILKGTEAEEMGFGKNAKLTAINSEGGVESQNLWEGGYKILEQLNPDNKPEFVDGEKAMNFTYEGEEYRYDFQRSENVENVNVQVFNREDGTYWYSLVVGEEVREDGSVMKVNYDFEYEVFVPMLEDMSEIYDVAAEMDRRIEDVREENGEAREFEFDWSVREGYNYLTRFSGVITDNRVSGKLKDVNLGVVDYETIRMVDGGVIDLVELAYQDKEGVTRDGLYVVIAAEYERLDGQISVISGPQNFTLVSGSDYRNKFPKGSFLEFGLAYVFGIRSGAEGLWDSSYVARDVLGAQEINASEVEQFVSGLDYRSVEVPKVVLVALSSGLGPGE